MSPTRLRAQFFVFKELLHVRYDHAKDRAIPWFRSIHWSIFLAATFWTEGRLVLGYFADKFPTLVYPIIKYHSLISFSLYAAVIIAIVLSLKKGFYRYQIGECLATPSPCIHLDLGLGSCVCPRALARCTCAQHPPRTRDECPSATCAGGTRVHRASWRSVVGTR